MSIFDSVSTDLSNFTDFVGALLDPHTYVRLFFVIIGAVLIISAFRYGGWF